MKLIFKQRFPGMADGIYHVIARGCVAASLHWADENGALPHWMPFGYLLLDSNGSGKFLMEGGRAVPEGASHVLARGIRDDFSKIEEALALVPKPAEKIPAEKKQCFLILTDLHLKEKTWQVRRALSLGRAYDAVLITGDITDDGTREQAELFLKCVEDLLPDTPVLAVSGDHDYPDPTKERIWAYLGLQQKLLARAEKMGLEVAADESGAYAVTLGDIRIFGLNPAFHNQKFHFPGNRQPNWLFRQLLESQDKRNVILCHAPLISHTPGEQMESFYLEGDGHLQRILDVERTEVIVVSGHTHLSIHSREGCVNRGKRKQLYLHAGSARSTVLQENNPWQPGCWTEGNAVELKLEENRTEITGIGIKSGQRFPGGHYRFYWDRCANQYWKQSR